MWKSIREHGLTVLFIISGLFGIFSVWTTNVSIEPQFIPTLMNGIVSSISLIVGFNITVNILLISRSREKDFLKISHLNEALMVLSVSFTLIVVSYLTLLRADYQLALRIALTGLYASFVLVVFSIMRIMSKAVKEALEMIKKSKIEGN